jgi:type I restriction enzyme S subunit
MGVKNASLKVLPKGTVLLSSRAPIGYLAISRGVVTTNQGFKSFIPNKRFSTYFIFYTVEKMIPTIANNAVGSTFKEVSGTTLKSIAIPIPSKSILENFDKRISNIFKKQDFLEQENQHLTALRDWLLPMLMNGQVRVKEVEGRMSMAAEPRADYKQELNGS